MTNKRGSLPPQLIQSGHVKRCSACEFPFSPAEYRFIPAAFLEHVALFHTPKRTPERKPPVAAR